MNFCQSKGTFYVHLEDDIITRVSLWNFDYSPVQVKNSVSVYIDRDSDRDSVRDRDKNNREKSYIDRDRDAK